MPIYCDLSPWNETKNTKFVISVTFLFHIINFYCLLALVLSGLQQEVRFFSKEFAHNKKKQQKKLSK